MIEHSYWLDTIPSTADIHNPQSTIRNRQSAIPSRADVLIVGAGYTGLAAARRLAKTGAFVLVIEREQAGYGASSRNAGQVLTGLRLAPARLVSRYGETQARHFFDASLESIAALEAIIAADSIDCEYERAGHIQLAAKASHFAAFRDEQSLLARVFNHRVELVAGAEQRREIGSDRYHGLLLDSHSATVNPVRLVAGLARSASRAGARIATGVEVQRVQRIAGGWTVSTSSGPVHANELFVATNGYTGAATPALQRRFVPVGSYIITTAPISAAQADAVLPRRRMAFDSKHFVHYFRVTADRRLLFGGRAEFTQPSAQTTRRAAAILRRDMLSVFPDLAGVPVEYAWGGKVAFTRDERPHAGRLDEGMYFAGGYAGHGIAMAAMLGDVVARRLAGESVAHPLMDDRCPAIPLYNGTPWFLPLAGAYYRVKDWLS